MSSSKIIAPTETQRIVLQGIISRVLTRSANPGIRRVQVLTPSAPAVALAVDHPDPETAGPGRVFMLPPAPPGQLIQFHLLPEQELYACTADGVGLAILGIIIEYLE